MITSTIVTAYTDDVANRSITANATTYTWDSNGNLTNDGNMLYRYDQANRLISTTLSGATTLFNYNGDGVRLKQIVAGVPTTYTQDIAAPLPVVLQAKTGTTATQYLYSMGTRPVAQYTSSAWQYLLPDALGSVRQIADANGNVLLSESYEPYGKLLSSSGSGSSIFGYSGEQFDTSGLIFLRARYMNPALGVFTSRDPFYASSPYRYASSNPINRIDPSGYIDWPTCVTQGDFGTCAATDGDWIYKIAREINAAGVAVDVPALAADIIALNPQIANPNHILVGQALTLRADWINAVIQSRNPQPPPSPVSPSINIQPWLPIFLKATCPSPSNIAPNIPLLTYSEGAAAVATALFGKHGAWMGVEVVYNLLTLEKVTFDVRGSVIVRQSVGGVYESDYYAFATGTSPYSDLARSYRGHFYNNCISVSTPVVSPVGLVECGFGSSDGSIGGHSTGTFTGLDFSLPLPPPLNIPGFGYADLDYNYLGGVARRYINVEDLKQDIRNGADSPLYPGKINAIQPIISAAREAAILILDQLY